MKTAAWIAGLLLLCGCSRTYESELLALKYEPPRGFDFIDESAGPPAKARFSNGLELLVVGATLPQVNDASLRPILEQALGALGESLADTDVLSSRSGTLRDSAVARYTLKRGSTRLLLYVVPRGDRFLVIRLTGSDSQYASLESHLELSLSSLRLR